LLQFYFLANGLHHTAFMLQRSTEMKIAVMARLLAEGNMYINTSQFL